jgi:hypothetical protein
MKKQPSKVAHNSQPAMFFITGLKEYPEYIGHFLLEFFIRNKKIPVKNDQCIQGTP